MEGVRRNVCACVAGATDTTSLRAFYRGSVPALLRPATVALVVDEALDALSSGWPVALPGVINKLSYHLLRVLPPRAALAMFADSLPSHVRETREANARAAGAHAGDTAANPQRR